MYLIRSNSFKEDDYILKQQIDAVKFYINDTNRLLHVISPKFSEDLQKPRRRKTSTTISYNINYSLLNDGVHPDNLIPKLFDKIINIFQIRNKFVDGTVIPGSKINKIVLYILV
jgi:hypothetical protein